MRRGFTVSEVLLALGVACLAVLALAGLSASVWRAAKFSKYSAYASGLAQQPIEKMKGDPDYLKILLTGPDSARHYIQTASLEEGQNTEFRVDLDVRPLAQPQDRYVRVVSKVSWTQQRVQREVVLETTQRQL
ncbi:MAG: hypothetical protein U0931_04950 [Vulcanimicrobiota bacterium]